MLGFATILAIVDRNDIRMHIFRRQLCGDGTGNSGVAGINGVVIVFNVTDGFIHRPV